MKGIVYDTESNAVLYKFDTPTPPTLQANQAIKLRNDIDAIMTGAAYIAATDTYVNPVITPPTDFSAMFLAAATDSEKIAVIAQKLGI